MVFSQQQRWAHPLRTKSAYFAPVGASGGSFTVSQTLGDSEWQRSVACCSPWSHRVGRDLAAEQLADLSKYIWPFHLGYRRRAPLCHSKASGGADLSQGPCVGGHLPVFWRCWAMGKPAGVGWGPSGGKRNGAFWPLCFEHRNSDEVAL